AWNLWGEERAIEFVDPSIRDSCSDQSSVMRCINVGLLCVQDSANDRPIMSTVVLMLESDTAILPTPRQPTFTMGRNPMKMELSTDSSEVHISRNNMTNTMVVGR
ncbi:G-type lectin S-receptor-like serine/threonine-protein kinase, partial [Thalictrum thalictroides]